jgi:hypothetical protein
MATTRKPNASVAAAQAAFEHCAAARQTDPTELRYCAVPPTARA